MSFPDHIRPGQEVWVRKTDVDVFRGRIAENAHVDADGTGETCVLVSRSDSGTVLHMWVDRSANRPHPAQTVRAPYYSAEVHDVQTLTITDDDLRMLLNNPA